MEEKAPVLKGKRRSPGKIILLVFLVLCASPVSLALLAFVFAVLCAVILTVAAVIFSIGITGIAAIAGGDVYKRQRLYLFHAKAGILCLRSEQCDHGKEEGQKGTADADRGSDFLFCRFFQQSDGQRDLSVYHLVKDGAGSFK